MQVVPFFGPRCILRLHSLIRLCIRRSKTEASGSATEIVRTDRLQHLQQIGCELVSIPCPDGSADVAEVLRILGGPDGTQPGVAIVDHRDEYGREVFLSGYGTGAIAALAAGCSGAGCVISAPVRKPSSSRLRRAAAAASERSVK